MQSKKAFGKILAFTVLVAVVFSLAAGFLVYSVRSTSAELQDVSKKVSESRLRSEDIRRVNHFLEQTETEREEIENLFLNGQDEVAAFLSRIEERAELLGVTSSIAVTTLESELTEKDALKINIELRGAFSDIYAVLRWLEALPVKAYFENTSLEFAEVVSDEDGNNTRVWRASVVIQILSFSE